MCNLHAHVQFPAAMHAAQPICMLHVQFRATMHAERAILHAATAKHCMSRALHELVSGILCLGSPEWIVTRR